MEIPPIHADASKEFLETLEGVTDPKEKRKTIGTLFIDVFKAEAKKIGGSEFLAQGTLYPDVVESVSFTGGPSVTIKSHHDVGALLARDLRHHEHAAGHDRARLEGTISRNTVIRLWLALPRLSGQHSAHDSSR